MSPVTLTDVYTLSVQLAELKAQLADAREELAAKDAEIARLTEAMAEQQRGLIDMNLATQARLGRARGRLEYIDCQCERDTLDDVPITVMTCIRCMALAELADTGGGQQEGGE